MAGCRYLVARCVDFRLSTAVDELLRELDITAGDYDFLSVAGGAGNLEVLLENLRIARQRHNIQTVILTVHEDCAAGAVEEDLFRARQAVREMSPAEVEIRLFYFYNWQLVYRPGAELLLRFFRKRLPRFLKKYVAASYAWAWREVTN